MLTPGAKNSKSIAIRLGPSAALTMFQYFMANRTRSRINIDKKCRMVLNLNKLMSFSASFLRGEAPSGPRPFRS